MFGAVPECNMKTDLADFCRRTGVLLHQGARSKKRASKDLHHRLVLLLGNPRVALADCKKGKKVREDLHRRIDGVLDELDRLEKEVQETARRLKGMQMREEELRGSLGRLEQVDSVCSLPKQGLPLDGRRDIRRVRCVSPPSLFRF